MDFRNPAECLQLLQRLQPANVDEAHATLYVIVGSLLDAAPPPNQHLEVLEAARPLLGTAQAAVASRYAACPLPPAKRATTCWPLPPGTRGRIACSPAIRWTTSSRRWRCARRAATGEGSPAWRQPRCSTGAPGSCGLCSASGAPSSAAVSRLEQTIRSSPQPGPNGNADVAGTDRATQTMDRVRGVVDRMMSEEDARIEASRREVLRDMWVGAGVRTS